MLLHSPSGGTPCVWLCVVGRLVDPSNVRMCGGLFLFLLRFTAVKRGSTVFTESHWCRETTALAKSGRRTVVIKNTRDFIKTNRKISEGITHYFELSLSKQIQYLSKSPMLAFRGNVCFFLLHYLISFKTYSIVLGVAVAPGVGGETS